MFRLLVLTSAIVVCGLGAPQVPARPKYPLESRIVGGSDIEITLVPYQLAFEHLERHICGASIISPDWAITSARCADEVQPENGRIRAGSAKMEQGGALFNISEIIIHEKYDFFLMDYDIALIRVSTPFNYGAGEQPIPLADHEPIPGYKGLVTGWGTTSYGGSARPLNLRGVTVPLIARDVCNDAYQRYGGITDRMMCAGDLEGGKDRCNGDNGGPLMHGSQLVGIVSWGAGCGYPGFPGVYTNVPNLRDWIREKSNV